LFNYKQKDNDALFGGEKSITKNIGLEMRYNIASKGSFLATFNYIDNYLSNTLNSSLAYEMLAGLQQGINTTWQISFQRNLSKHMQLSINYNGRKSEQVKTIHSGNVQVRAYF